MFGSLRRLPWVAVPVVVTLALVTVSLVVTGGVSPLELTQFDEVRGYFDVVAEGNLPTWWSATILALAAVACGVVAALSGRRGARFRWLLLAGLIAALSIDEATVLHERLDRLVLPWLSPEDFPYLWVVPGLVLAAVILVGVVGLTRAVPRPVRRRLALGFVLLLVAAVGGEVVQGLLFTRGLTGWPFIISYHLEELGEMLGAIALLAGAVRMLDVRREPGGVRMRLVDAPPSSVRVGREADDHLPDVGAT